MRTRGDVCPPPPPSSRVKIEGCLGFCFAGNSLTLFFSLFLLLLGILSLSLSLLWIIRSFIFPYTRCWKCVCFVYFPSFFQLTILSFYLIHYLLTLPGWYLYLLNLFDTKSSNLLDLLVNPFVFLILAYLLTYCTV